MKHSEIYKEIKKAELPAETKEQVLAEIMEMETNKAYAKQISFSKTPSFLISAFVWSDTKQGFSFWDRIFDKLEGK
jgi:hypothetical protein